MQLYSSPFYNVPVYESQPSSARIVYVRFRGTCPRSVQAKGPSFTWFHFLVCPTTTDVLSNMYILDEEEDGSRAVRAGFAYFLTWNGRRPTRSLDRWRVCRQDRCGRPKMRRSTAAIYKSIQHESNEAQVKVSLLHQ